MEKRAFLLFSCLAVLDWFTFASDSPGRTQAAADRVSAMMHWMWSDRDTQWRDWNTGSNSSGQADVASNFMPLWSGCFGLGDVNESAVVDQLVEKVFLQCLPIISMH